jgi:hypothetical protein
MRGMGSFNERHQDVSAGDEEDGQVHGQSDRTHHQLPVPFAGLADRGWVSLTFKTTF